MPRRKTRHVEKPWIRDPAVIARWQAIIDRGKKVVVKRDPLPAPTWQLWRWDTLEDAPQ